jgi:hypothetical protein
MAKVNPKSLLKMLSGVSKNTPGTGMKDDVSAVIDGQTPAALSAGEHVWDAETVSMIGDGNNEAGHRILDEVKAMLREAKTGQKEQSNPMAELFSGGKVKAKYASGGKVMTDVNKNQMVAPPTEPPNGPNMSAILQRLMGSVA